MIIHICGPVGCGKSTLAMRLSVWIPRVIDTDEMFDDWIRDGNGESYQNYVHEIIDALDGDIVFAGINADLDGWNGTDKFTQIDLRADHKFLINTPLETVIEQRVIRSLRFYASKLYGCYNYASSGSVEFSENMKRIFHSAFDIDFTIKSYHAVMETCADFDALSPDIIYEKVIDLINGSSNRSNRVF